MSKKSTKKVQEELIDFEPDEEVKKEEKKTGQQYVSNTN